MKTVRTKPAAFWGFWLAFIAAIALSTKAIFVKLAFRDAPIDPAALLTLRMVLSLPFFVAIAIYVSLKKGRVRFTPLQWVQVGVLGLFGYYLSSLFDFIGLQYISAGLERMILFLYPTFAVLINAIRYHQPIRPRQRWALGLTYAGLVISFAGEMHLAGGNIHFYIGSLFVLACAVTYAIYLVGNGRLASEVGAIPFTAYAMLAATAGVLIHYCFTRSAHPLQLTPHLLWLGIWLAVLATVIPSLLFSMAMQHVGSSNVSIISSIGPVTTILLAHWILFEPIYAAQIAGTILIIAGVLLTSKNGDQK